VLSAPGIEVNKEAVFSKKVKLVNENGLHARPATRFVEAASRFTSDITITKDGQEVNGKSVIEILTLGASAGTLLTITAIGNDAEKAVKTLCNLVKNRFLE
jgi:phosphotransferase system HPr (HPr) family protein